MHDVLNAFFILIKGAAFVFMVISIILFIMFWAWIIILFVTGVIDAIWSAIVGKVPVPRRTNDVYDRWIP